MNFIPRVIFIYSCISILWLSCPLHSPQNIAPSWAYCVFFHRFLTPISTLLCPLLICTGTLLELISFTHILLASSDPKPQIRTPRDGHFRFPRCMICCYGSCYIAFFVQWVMNMNRFVVCWAVPGSFTLDDTFMEISMCLFPSIFSQHSPCFLLFHYLI